MKWRTYSRSLRTMQKMILSPVTGWDDVLTSPIQSTGWHMKHFVLPVVLLILVAHLVGYLILAITIGNYSIPYVLVKTLATFFDTFFTFFVTIIIVTEWTRRLGWSISYDRLFLVNSYSLSAFWLGKMLAGLLANYPTLGSFFVFLGVTGIYPFILGAERLNLVESHRMNKLLAMNIGVFVLLYLLIRWVFDFPLKMLYYLHTFNQ
ncbi:MAG: hypothetical protein WHT29_10955 [Bacteroidales bacterium]|nr:hypothetical protein [Bacteroidales bacterium]HOK98267.1 hypothetical protein [Bacteroidales bacterium]HPO65177.1 hypothetical protein [Bacteroidales bacterium]